jgi:two-component system, OmpR family, sensor histidine kinase KdpD
VLDAGIDVYSTVNVQHLESLNDSVCELTGVRVRETMPDTVLNSADEVVLMDLTPEALLDRLRDGKIYPAERIDSALNNFFRIENLAALREVALRQVAQEVESKRMVKEPVGQREDRLADSAATQAVGERLLALIKPTPRAQRLVRRAFRSAQRLGADLDLLWVKKPGYKPTAEEQNQLDGIGRVAALLGAHLLVEEGDDVAQTVKEVAEEKGSTYVMIGTPKPRTGLDRLRPSMVSRLIESLPGVDLRVVADRARRGEEEQ